MRLDTLHYFGDVPLLTRESPINNAVAWVRQLFVFLNQEEGYRTLPYFDRSKNDKNSSDNPLARATIGYGFNIEDATCVNYLKLVLREMGIINGTMSATDINARVNAFRTAISSTPHGFEYNTQLQANLDAVAQQYNVSTFSINKPQSDNVFLGIVLGLQDGNINVQGKMEKLDAYLNNQNEDVLAHNSNEYIAVMSLFYNGEGLVGARTNLAKAIINDNRAEAWYEIRYGSNSQGIHANRRYKEANLFGLYDYGSYAGSLTPEEAKEVMRMYTIHRTKIDDYETKYSPPLNQNILSIGNEILLAKDFLITNFAPGKTINEVIVGAGLSTYEYKDQGNYKDNLLGTANNDLIFGEKGDDSIVAGNGNDVVYGGEGNDFIAGEIGDDVLYGGEGNDTIIGGKGNDILEGGAGNDDYIFQSGDGSDKINDSQGTNRILWEDNNGNLHVEKTFYKTADAQWKSADGTTEVNQNSPYKMVFQDGTTVELGESISSFDINLKDVLANSILLVV